MKVKFGNFQKTTYISTENLFKVSKRVGSQNLTLAELCSKIGLKVDRTDLFSDRVCQACGRKIRTVFELYSFIKLSLTREKETIASVSLTSQADQLHDDESSRFKRLLPSTISSPDRSPRARKGPKTPGKDTVAKKSLSFRDASPSSYSNDDASSNPNRENITPMPPSEIAFSQLSVEDLLESATTEVKIVLVNPNGRVDTFCSFDDKTKSMIVNLCRKRLKPVANLAFEHPKVREELGDPLRRTVGKELKEYCNEDTDSVLKKSRPEDVAAFSNKVLVHEAEVWCPFWMNCIKGACNVRS